MSPMLNRKFGPAKKNASNNAGVGILSLKATAYSKKKPPYPIWSGPAADEIDSVCPLNAGIAFVFLQAGPVQALIPN